MTLLDIFIGLFGLLVIANLAWRFASRRCSLPCPASLRWLVESDSPFLRTARTALIVQRLHLQPGMRVLDIGCGTGRITIPIAREVGPQGEVVAVDLQAPMLRRALEKAQAASLNNIQFLRIELGDGKLQVGQADRALLVTVLGEIPNREKALRNIFDALKPGGMLSVTEVIFDPHFQPRGTVLRLAGAVGFAQKEFFGNRLAFTLNLEKPRGA